ncbi:MAG: CDP-alcohol phosphatidyltransferase family protein [Minisyncoccia bacterium]
MNKYWIPNAVSVSRAFPCGLLVLLFALERHWLAAGIVSVIGIGTDTLDGLLAVHLNARTKAGTIIDPICDFILTLGQIAGAFYSALIGWKMIWILVVLFLITWPPVVLVKNELANKFFLACNRGYYAAVVVGFTGLYFYEAMGVNSVWLLIPAIPFAYTSARSSIGRHKVS